jgi:signal transduction histidine kinase
VFGVALAVLSQTEVWVFGTAGGGWTGALSLLVVAAGACWRGRLPWLSAAVVLAGGFLEAAWTGKPGTVTWTVAVMVSWFTLGALERRRQAYLALGLSVLLTAGITEPFSVNVFLAILLTTFGVPWLLGALRWRYLHGRRVEAHTMQAAEAAVAAERLRLARELHDVVSHNVGMIAVQAGAGDVLLDEHPERARESLHAIERGAREALVELRRLLGLLRTSDSEVLPPEPGLAELEALVSRVREAGLSVESSVEGEPRPLTRTADLAAYRIVQEALTNALKHAGPCRVTVRLRYGQDALEVEVTDDGRGPGAADTGFGLRGITERVAALGGRMEVGANAPRGFRLIALLPVTP